MVNAAKIQKVDDIAKSIEGAKSAALVQYQGLNAADFAAMRDQIRVAGGTMEVVKNSLLTRALEKIGIKLPEELTGPTSLALCNTDEIAPLKAIEKVNKEKEVTSFKYGIYDKKLLLVEDLKKFLSLPSKSVLVSKLLGGLINPLQRIVYAMRFNQTQLALILKALEAKKATN